MFGDYVTFQILKNGMKKKKDSWAGMGPRANYVS